MRWKWNFATECPSGQRGRPLSPGSVEKAGGGNVCEKRIKTGERKGQTIYYRTGEHKATQQKERESKKQEKQKARESKKQEQEKRKKERKERPSRGKSEAKIVELQERIKQLESQAKAEVYSAVAEIPVNQIAVDPKRFQYKILGAQTATGEAGSLSGVGKWNPELAGIVQVWKDQADGKTYVVNGHNRFALARRSGAEKIAVRYMAVKSDKEARAVGALTNLAEGKGNSLDAAKFFRDTGLSKADLAGQGVKLSEKIVEDGLGISVLPKLLYNQVIDGDIKAETGAAIGRSGFDEQKQFRLYEMVAGREKKGYKVDSETISTLAEVIKDAATETHKEEDLFGEVEQEDDYYFELADLQNNITRRLSREKRIFGTATRGAKELSTVGSLDVGAAANRAKRAQEYKSLFEELKNTQGRIKTLLNQGASRIKKAGSRKEREAIQDEIYKVVYEALPETRETLWSGVG